MGAINQALAANKILRFNDFELLGMVQSFDWAPALGAQDIDELGNFDKVDTAYDLRTSGSVEFNSIGNTAGILARMIPNRTAVTGVFNGYQYNSGGAGLKNGYTFTEANLVETRFDIIQHERPDGINFSRSLWLPRCNLASMTGSARADGFATESMTFQGNDVVGFSTPYHDIRSVPCTVTNATTLQAADTAVSSTTHTLAYVYVNDRRFRNATTADTSTFTLGAAGAITLTTSVSYSVPADADCHALVYKTTPATTFPSITTAMRGTTANYVRGQQVNIFIAPVTVGTPLDSEKFLRVQNVNWAINMGLQELMQIEQNDKGSAIYNRVPTLPLDVSVDCTVYETDWNDWKAMLNKSFTGTVYNSTYEFAPSVLKTQFAVVVEFWTKGNPASRAQVYQFLDMAPTSRGTRVAMKGRGEVTWNFSGTRFSLQGFNV